MAITTINQYLAAPKQIINWQRGAVNRAAGTAYAWNDLRDLPGVPGACASINAADATNGAVVTGGSNGHPTLNTFGGSATGYLTRVATACHNGAPSRYMIVDRIFEFGPFSANATTTASAPPSWSTRVPGGSYGGLMIAAQTTTNLGSVIGVTVGYTNENGVTGRSTGINYCYSAKLGELTILSLQAGDSGVSAINSVNFTGFGSGGAMQIVVFRQLFHNRQMTGISNQPYDLIKTGMPIVLQNSALEVWQNPEWTPAPTGYVSVTYEVANG